jgi:hypothetical protein
MLSVIMLNITYKPYKLCLYAECFYSECRYAEYPCAECRGAKMDGLIPMVINKEMHKIM